VATSVAVWKKQTTTDLIFGFQVICAVGFGGGQFLRMLDSVRGVSGAMFVFSLTFLFINLYLAIKGYGVKRTRVIVQLIAFMALGVAVYSGLLVLLIVKGGFWDGNDKVTSLLVLVGVSASLLVGKSRGLNWKDPIIKGWLALSFKAVPQLMMAWKIAIVGGTGVSGIFILTFHLLTLSRILLIFWEIQKVGWDRNRKGMLVSEIGNELSWVVVTTTWAVQLSG